jgi:hypothetical protein
MGFIPIPSGLELILSGAGAADVLTVSESSGVSTLGGGSFLTPMKILQRMVILMKQLGQLRLSLRTPMVI